MSLRALASLLTRRFSSRGAQAQRSAAVAGRPALCSLRILVSSRFPQNLSDRKLISSLAAARVSVPSVKRNLDVGIGAFALSSVAGLLRFLYFKQDWDDSAVEETRKEKEKAVVDDAAGTDEDNVVDDEAAMKAIFEDWMNEHGRRYRTEEEKAHRYENFKKAVKDINKLNAKRGMRSTLLAPNELADYGDEEIGKLGTPADESYLEGYLDHAHTIIARGDVIGPKEDASEAMKKVYVYP